MGTVAKKKKSKTTRPYECGSLEGGHHMSRKRQTRQVLERDVDNQEGSSEFIGIAGGGELVVSGLWRSSFGEGGS